MFSNLYSKEEFDDTSTTPFLSRMGNLADTTNNHALKRQQRTTSSLVRHRNISLPLVTILSFTIFTLYFNIPSTLWFYLTAIFVLLPISILQDLPSLYLLKFNLKTWWTRNRIIWASIELIGLILLCLPQLAAFSTMRWNRPLTTTITTGLNQRYFISANLYQSQDVLPNFTSTLLDLTETLGRENVFISIYESNSKDRTKELLGQFDQELTFRNISHSILTDDVGDHVEAGLSEKAGRIKYLAHARNLAMASLYSSSHSDGASSDTTTNSSSNRSEFQRKYDKVIWLNDVFFKKKDVLELLATNGGFFDQTCGLDFQPLGFYDTWVTRSAVNDRLKVLWPHFSSSDDIERLRKNLPIEVNSCWNGMTIFNAKWFSANYTSTTTTTSISASTSTIQPSSISSPLLINSTSSSDHQSTTKIGSQKMRRVQLDRMVHLEKRKTRMPINMTVQDPDPLPLRFRTSARCYSSECLLISLDLHRALVPHGIRPLILINPKVKVAYDSRTYYLYSNLMRSSVVVPWQLIWQDLISNRIFGWVTELGRKPDLCREAQLSDWAPPPSQGHSEPLMASEKA